MTNGKSLIESNTARLTALDLRRREQWRQNGQCHTAAYQVALREFRDNYDQLAFPGGLELGLQRLAKGESGATEHAIQFLEVDPRFFRSGYIKQTILQRLKHADVNATQRARLALLIIRSVHGGGRREFYGYARLAGALQQPEVEAEVQRLATDERPEVRFRVRRILHNLQSRRHPEYP